MTPTPNQLKSVNPLLVWNSDDEINKTVSHLEEQKFFWSESRKVFCNERLGVTVSVREIKEIINGDDLLERRIKEAKERDKKEEYLGSIKVAGKLINFLIFLIIMNLFLGWLVLHFFFWIFLEIFFVICLIAFVKMRKKIRMKLSKEAYISPETKSCPSDDSEDRGEKH